MKPSATNLYKNEETKVIKNTNIIPTSNINLFISDLDENKFSKEIKENKNLNNAKENPSKNVTGVVKRSEVEVNKNESNKQPNGVKSPPKKELNLFDEISSKRILEIPREDIQLEIKINKKSNKSEEKIDEKQNSLINRNEATINLNLKKEKQKGPVKSLDIGLVNSSLIPDQSVNQNTMKGDLSKIFNSNTSINNTGINTIINKNESVISNLSGILKEMVKSDKEKTLKNQNDENDYNSKGIIIKIMTIQQLAIKINTLQKEKICL